MKKIIITALFSFWILSRVDAQIKQIFVQGLYDTQESEYVNHYYDDSKSLDTIYVGEAVQMVFYTALDFEDNVPIRYNSTDVSYLDTIGYLPDTDSVLVEYNGKTSYYKRFMFSVDERYVGVTTLRFYPGINDFNLVIIPSPVLNIKNEIEAVQELKVTYYNLQGKKLPDYSTGVMIEEKIYSDGRVERKKICK